MCSDEGLSPNEELGRRLHSGPLQGFFAALLLIEVGADEHHDQLVAVLEAGAAELRAIIQELNEG